MRSIAVHPPLTALEVYEILPDSTLAEVIDDKIYSPHHPLTATEAFAWILPLKFLHYTGRHDLGRVFIAPFDVYLDEKKNLVQPDILFILKENAHIIQGHVHGSPDLIIEILSPSNKRRDLIIKKKLYEKFAVKEYWIIDPETNAAFGFQLQNGTYVKLPTEKNQLTSPLLKNVFVF